MKASERKCAKLAKTVEDLEADKSQYVTKIKELMESLEFIQTEYQSNKQELKELKETNQILQEKKHEIEPFWHFDEAVKLFEDDKRYLRKLFDSSKNVQGII